MKYQLKLTPTAKQVAEWQLEQYPEEKKQLEILKNDLIVLRTQNFENVGGTQYNLTRPTEANALRLISAPYLQRMEIGCAAVESILAMLDPIDKALIETVFWKKSNNVTGAAMDIYLSRSQAYRRLHDILGGVAAGMGFVKVEHE